MRDRLRPTCGESTSIPMNPTKPGSNSIR
jgi:hypothetical protein